MDAFNWGILLACRILPTVVMVPALGGNRLPIPIKVSLTAVITMILLDKVQLIGSPPSGTQYLLLVLKEVAVGMVLALSASCLFQSFRMAGELMDLFRGDSSYSMLLPQTEENTTPLGLLHLLMSIVLFFALGGPFLWIKALEISLDQLPLAVFPNTVDTWPIADLALRVTGEAIRSGLVLAFPMALAMLVSDIVLGFINRAAPQMPMYFVGLPIKAMLGIGVAVLTCNSIMEDFVRQFSL